MQINSERKELILATIDELNQYLNGYVTTPSLLITLDELYRKL